MEKAQESLTVVIADDDNTTCHEQSMSNSTEQSSPRNALVVDDGPVERLAGKAMLVKLGFSVKTAASGEEALDLLDQQAVALVLCDISMPGMSGLMLLEAARRKPHPPLFIMSSSHSDTEHAAASLRSGASGYLTKPLSFDTLRDTVTKALAAQPPDV